MPSSPLPRRRARRRRLTGDAGQALPLLVALLVVALALTVVLGRIGVVAADRGRAQTAADAAALAGAQGGRAAAARLAAAHGAALVVFARHGEVVEVEVALGSASAAARARLVVPDG